MAKRLFGAAQHAPKGSLVYMDIGIGQQQEPAGRVIFELFEDYLPRTCQNFETLITREKESYKGSLFHRAIPGLLVQGGDVASGDNLSAEGEKFPDENFLF